jgi:hypothetical protein
VTLGAGGRRVGRVRRHELPERREQDADSAPREPERPPAESSVLQLQRTAGNRAVSALLARQPAPADAAPKPADSRKAAAMTVGLGADDEFVIPVDSMQWQYDKALVVSFDGENPAFPELHQAWGFGRRFETGFASTHGLMSRLTGVTITSMTYSTAGDEPVAVMGLLAEDVKHEPVK